MGWQKVSLQPGASQQVTIEVDANDVSEPLGFWDVDLNAWVIQPGTYTVYLGNSSTASLITAGTLQLTPSKQWTANAVIQTEPSPAANGEQGQCISSKIGRSDADSTFGLTLGLGGYSLQTEFTGV